MWRVVTSTVGLFLRVSQDGLSHRSGGHARLVSRDRLARFSHPTMLNSVNLAKQVNSTKYAIGENAEYLAYKECIVLIRTQDNEQTLKEY
jgi:hypothetical protein